MEINDDYAADWAACHDIADLASKYDPLTPEQELLVIDLYYYKTRAMIHQLVWANCCSFLLYELVLLNTKLLHQLILRNLRLVIKIAKRYMGKGIPLIDLICEGIAPLGTKRSGLIYAIRDKFEPDKKFKISTYATWWIRQAVSRHIENKSRLVKLPQQILGIASKIDTCYRDYVTKCNGERPDSQELADAVNLKWPGTNITAEKVAEIGRFRFEHVSLNDDCDDSGAMIEFLTYDESIEEEIESKSDKDYIMQVVNQLPPLERNLIIWKFGLIDYNVKRSNKEISMLIGLDVKHYKETEARALNTLKKLVSYSRINLFTQ